MALATIFHLIEKLMLLSFNDHIWLLRVVAFLLVSSLKLLVCPLNLFLNVLSVSPMYDSSLLSLLFTTA